MCKNFLAVVILLASSMALATEITKVTANPAGMRTVSPDGGVEAEFSLSGGQPSVAFSCGGVAVGRMTVGPDLGLGDFKVLKTASDAHRGSWKPVYGFRSEYPDNYSELTVFLSCGDSDARRLQVTVRAYDEGIAVRYSFVPNVYCEAELKSERTAISFSAGSVCWGIRETEGCYPEEPVSIGLLDRSVDWYMPLTLRTPEGVYASVLEANTVAWPRSVLRADGQGGFGSRFVRGSMIGRGVCTSPWRAVLLAPDAKGLIERAYFVWNLNESCALMDTGWIKPGLTVSDLGNCELRMSEVIAAARAAKAVGARYLQLDWGWYGTEYPWTAADRADYLARYPDRGKDTSWFENTKADPYTPARGFVPYHPTWPGDGKRTGVDLDMPKLIAEMDGIGIGLCLYVHGLVLERSDLDRLFATYASWGVAGLKPGFVSFGSQQATDWLRNLAATAAKHRLWLDIHDQQIPDGFERTWPNVMINEGGGGAEWPAYPPHHELVHPFTRCLAGAFDYTPVFFTTNRTHAHSAAFCICYPGPTAVMRGKVGNLSTSDPAIVEFLKALPWTYDETRVLDGEIAQRLVVARRKGDRWFLGGMSGARAQETSIGTEWLEPGVTYELKAVTDAGTDARMLRRGDPLRVRMSAAGGYVATVTPVRAGEKGK